MAIETAVGQTTNQSLDGEGTTLGLPSQEPSPVAIEMEYIRKKQIVRRWLVSQTGEKIRTHASNIEWADYLIRHGRSHGLEVNEQCGHQRFVHDAIHREYIELLRHRRENAVGSYVYIIGSLEMGFVKIGKAKDPAARIDSLQVGCPYELSVFAVFKERGLAFEKKLHDRARPYHHRGEWFRIAGRLRAFILAQKPITRDELRIRLEAGVC